MGEARRRKLAGEYPTPLDVTDPVAVVASFREYASTRAKALGGPVSGLIHASCECPAYWFGYFDDLFVRNGVAAQTAVKRGEWNMPPGNFCVFFSLYGGEEYRQPLAHCFQRVSDREYYVIGQYFKNGVWRVLNSLLNVELTDRENDNLRLQADGDEGVAQTMFTCVTALLGVLNSQGGYRYVNASSEPRTLSGKSQTQPAAVAKEPSPLKIIYVNRIETIRPQSETAHGTGTGLPKSPHDRIGSWCVSKLGNPFWRKPAKIHGGAVAATRPINIVRLANPL